MMESEAGTPVATRLPDEETTFIARKVEAPHRRQRQQQLQAKRKRLAVLTAATVTMLAFGALGVFLTVPSDTSSEVKTAVSQAMASAATKADRVFVPNFDVYDEDGDDKVSLGEYLDRMTINRDAALEKVTASSLDEDEKTRISDAVNEDFKEHSECVSNIAQDHEDEMMTKENFKEVYQIITKEFCPMNDDDIPDSYQVTETAPGKEEEVPIEVHRDVANSDFWGSTSDSLSSESSQGSSGLLSDGSSESSSSENSQSSNSFSSSESSQDSSDSLSSENSQSSTSGSSSSPSEGFQSSSDESSEEATWNPEKPTFPPRPVHTTKPDGLGGEKAKMWTPIYPTDPPISDRKGSGWNPDDPSDTPTASQNSGNTEAESSSTTGEDVDTTKIGVGDGQWNPTRPANPPKPIHKEELDEKANYSGGNKEERKPEATGWKAPITGQGKQPTNRAYSAFSAFLSNDDTWAYNNYMAGNTNTYTRSIKTPSYPEASAQQYPSIEDTRGDGQQARAYSPYSTNSAYTNADFGSSNAYVESDMNTYMKTHKAQMQREPAAQESPSNEATYEDEQQDRAYSPYSTNSAYTNTEDFGSNNAYVESDTNTYMSSHKAQMQRKPTAQESPSNEAKYADQQHPRAFNLYSTNSEYTNMESPANNAYADSDKYKYRSIKAQISSEAEVHQSSSGEAPNTNSDRYKYRSIKAQIYPETDGHQPPSNEEIHDNEQPSRAFNADSAYTTNVITGGEKEFTGNAQSEDVLRGEDDDFSRGRKPEGGSYKSTKSRKQLRRTTP